MQQFITKKSSSKKEAKGNFYFKNPILRKCFESKHSFLISLVIFFSCISFLSFTLLSYKKEKNTIQNDVLEFSDLLERLEDKLNFLKIGSEKVKEQKTTYEKTLQEKTTLNNEKLIKLSQIINQKNQLTNNLLQNNLSEILSVDDISLIENWTGKKFLFPCFASAGHLALSGKQFHNMCDPYPNTVAVVKTKGGSIMGGFTTQTWEGETEKYDDKAFVFNLNDKKKYHIKQGKTAISCSYDNLPVFGYDLALTKEIYYSTFPSNYQGDDQDPRSNPLYGEGKTMIEPAALEVFVLN